MRSKITIDVDQDNAPVIKVEYVQSEDVRDKLVKKFLESFESISCWTKVHYLENPGSTILNSLVILKPISSKGLKDLSEESAHSLKYVPENLPPKD